MKTPAMHKEIIEATKLFKRVIAHNGMQKFNIIGWSNDIILPYLTDQEAWLAVWMLKSDELATSLFEKRIWNVGYRADKDCLEGVKPIPIEEAEPEGANLKSYEKIPVATMDEIPLGLRFKLCNSAFIDSLIVKDRSVGIKPIFSFAYELEKPLEHGEYLPYSSYDNLVSKLLNDFNLEVNSNPDLSPEQISENTI